MTKQLLILFFLYPLLSYSQGKLVSHNWDAISTNKLILTNDHDSLKTISPTIYSNKKIGRSELLVNSGKNSFGHNFDGSSIHLYGKNDIEHPGALSLLTGGYGRFMINQFGQIAIGGRFATNPSNRDQLFGYLDNGKKIGDENGMDGFLNIINHQGGNSGIPSLYFSSSNMDICWNSKEHLQFGTWNREFGSEAKSGIFKSILTLKNTGNIIVESGYIISSKGIIFKSGSASENIVNRELLIDVTPFNLGLKTLMKIKPKKYTFKDDKSQYRVGLTSTELTNILPSYLNKRDFVDLGIKKSVLTFDDSSLHYIIINSIKEQQKQIIELIESNKLLLSKIKELEDK
ncbi:MAG: hypothetical protein CMD16_02495 [Flavobacteriales bacterium]|nr:hypothetical protein [Flavobacteriales bacterium]|tara:strand:- start:5214 stop:6248 length:1035 start_codon:yes stop_codon:yes gene_type:complete